MIKKDVTYTNFNGQITTEPFYFHMSQAELLRLEVGTKGGLQKALETMVAAEDGAAIMDFMETFIKQAVGKKSEDGSRFNKSDEIREDFVSSPAYDTLFMELVTNPDKAAEFLNGIVPAEMAANVEKLSKLEQVKANVAKREGKAEELITEFDPREGGNAFEQETWDPDRATISDERVPVPLSAVNDEGKIEISEKEMREMDPAELQQKLATGNYVLAYK